MDDQPGEMRERWPADMRRCDLSAMARRPGPAHHQDGSFLSLEKGEPVRLDSVHELGPVDMLRSLAGTPFRPASFAGVHREWGDRAEPYRARSFGGGHYPHGWACAFRSKGHLTLVSRRWLEHGPWRLLRAVTATRWPGSDRSLA
ncbi:hypothetical protein ACFYUK_47365 [Nonomuraea wenchangensis]